MSSRERVDSEKNYLRAVLRDLDRAKKEGDERAEVSPAEVSPSGSVAALLRTHPRFEALHAKYGADLIPMVRTRVMS